MHDSTANSLSTAEIRDMAIRYLARREYGVNELRYKLQYRCADPIIVDQVIEDLVDGGMVSDQRFAEMYVRTRMSRLFGPLKIRGELKGRGISDSVIDNAIPGEPEAWIELAVRWAAKRHNGEELDFTERARIHRSLSNRGFTHDHINTALSRLKQ